MILISDAISATGLSDGDYMLGGKRVIVKDGVARNEAGALSGSTVTLHDCVRRAISFGIPRDEALKMASETPAAYLGVKKGKVAVGYDADLLVVDEALNVLETILCDQL
jgi:N-acetylglucosamine-6-phosphate deacetylase